MRHSLATILRNRGIARWDLEGSMGYNAGGSTEVHANGHFASVATALNDVLGEVVWAPPALCTETAPKSLYPVTPLERQK